MKSSIVVMALSAALFGVVVTGCNTPAENVKNAQSNVVDANADLDKANKEYLADIDKTRIETSEKIAANSKTMAEFDFRIANEKADAKAEYKAKMTELDNVSHMLKTGESIIIPAHSRATIKANERFKMISTIIRNGYDDVS